MKKRYEAESANILAVEVETNCPKGGDSGHGGLTTLKLEDLTSTDMRVNVDGVDYGDRYGHVSNVTLTFGGDTEAETLLECLRFAVKTLEEQLEENQKNN